jgi:peptidoglycan/LPS O-acetylase OafA/YrhL
MVFYLVFPIFYKYVNDYRKALGFLFFTLLLAALYSGGLSYLPIVETERSTFAHFSFLHVLTVFAFGMLTFFVYERFVQLKRLPRSWGVVLVGGALFGYCALILGRLNFFLEDFYWQAVNFCALTLGLTIAPLRLFVNRPTCFSGRIAYSLYLNHPPLVFVLIPVYRAIYAVQLPTTLQYGACALLTLTILAIASYLTYHLIEQHGVRLGNRLIENIRSRGPSSNRLNNIQDP